MNDAALPSNAHTYRLLIVKEPSTSRHQNPGSRRRQIVLFVSSREMRLCGVSSFSSTTFYYSPKNFLLPTSTSTRFVSLKLRSQNSPNFSSAASFISRRSQREANYSKPSHAPASTLLNIFRFTSFYPNPRPLTASINVLINHPCLSRINRVQYRPAGSAHALLQADPADYLLQLQMIARRRNQVRPYLQLCT